LHAFVGVLVAEDDVADDVVGDEAGLAAAEGGVGGVLHELLDEVGVFGRQVGGAGGDAFGGDAGGRFASPRYLVHLRIPQLATRASILLARLPDADQIGRSVLLGRDFLQFYRLVYDGPTGDVTLQVSS